MCAWFYYYTYKHKRKWHYVHVDTEFKRKSSKKRSQESAGESLAIFMLFAAFLMLLAFIASLII